MNIQISDFAKICRLCLGIDEQMKCLFPEASEESNKMEEIRKMIDALIVYPVSKSDNLPNNICSKCIDQIRTTHNFKNRCERSFELLKSMLETYKLGLKNETDHILEELLKSEEIEKNVKSEDAFEYMETISNDGKFNSVKNHLDRVVLSGRGEREKDELEFIETISDDGEFDCTYCVKSFSQDVHLRKHISIMHTNVCNLCNKRCRSPKKLETHISRCHPENNMKSLIKCKDGANESCSEEAPVEYISDDSELLELFDPKIDSKSPTSDNSYNASSYVNDNQSVGNLKGIESKTKRKQNNGKNLKMAKTVTDDNQSKVAKYIASKRPDHRCNICNKSFCNSATLKRHQQNHSEKKPKCKVCNKVFSRADYLRIHQLHQHRVKPYACPDCGAEFSLASDVKKHQWRHHPPAVKDLKNDISPTNSSTKCFGGYKCNFCDKCFTFRSNLSRHLKTHPDYQDSRKHCPEKFNSETMLKHKLDKLSQISHAENIAPQTEPQKTEEQMADEYLQIEIKQENCSV